jgi:sugar/nucleoside kinase (ribokinase family)
VLKLLTDRGIRFSADFFLPSARHLITAAAPWLPHASWIFANARERLLLDSALETTALGGVIITDGPRPVRLIRHGHQVAAATPPTTTPIAGTYLAHLSRGDGMATALEAAVDAASRHTTAPPLNLHRN